MSICPGNHIYTCQGFTIFFVDGFDETSPQCCQWRPPLHPGVGFLQERWSNPRCCAPGHTPWNSNIFCELNFGPEFILLRLNRILILFRLNSILILIRLNSTLTLQILMKSRHDGEFSPNNSLSWCTTPGAARKKIKSCIPAVQARSSSLALPTLSWQMFNNEGRYSEKSANKFSKITSPSVLFLLKCATCSGEPRKKRQPEKCRSASLLDCNIVAPDLSFIVNQMPPRWKWLRLTHGTSIHASKCHQVHSWIHHGKAEVHLIKCGSRKIKAALYLSFNPLVCSRHK